MVFGKATGPPASHHQIQELIELLERAGHTDFRDARGPMGFTQRQANGKFTRDEAQQFIEQLEEAEAEADAPPGMGAVRAELQESEPEIDAALREFPSEKLAAELERRGWRVTKR